ncbi:hypothetical protein Kpol_541p15 [Vanderwaltozyma polyspora DSM 70294]|uniref:Vanadate resistance protein n=1 Tax=Vanderwaltozyma polyspora (strain ATCC 22028 / DSM 70294 / BCRC 21397 / CBS 2163 / NBRC 10782 / NRRL Y-8283 / UCD 57-17) TaxID=436907 RepID=A7TIW0_VANPO|nr:uncharacterized protein Kpol_541p15 [Vanderwaltozyma polyspora DSM 70294]EDO17772.1 hypothetical protein Kpol_541p15 [Vanderwaltozyma polyspora DSM 70294]
MDFLLNNKRQLKKKDELPISDSRWAPKSKYRHKFNPANSENFVKINAIITLILFLVFICQNSFSSSSSNVVDSHTNEAKILEDNEYYDYDFKNFDEPLVKKFDDGAKHYLISKYGSEVLTPEDKSRYEQELQELLSTTVQNYDLSKYSGTENGIQNREHVLLCVPLRDAEDVLPLMFKNIMNLTYPHELIDLAFLVSDCTEGDHTLESLIAYSRHLQDGTLAGLFQEMDKDDSKKDSEKLYLKYMNKDYLKMVEDAYSPPFHNDYEKPFRSVQIFQKDFGQEVGQGFTERHSVKVQGIRRKLMGRARNWLMTNALKPYHAWVYWRDADVELCPGTVIEDLMSKNFDVMVPNVWRPLPEFLNSEQPYDLNSWMESNEALKLAKNLDEDDVIVEGYAEYPTWRVHLAYIREKNGNPNQVVDLDGVGGVSILVKAKLFRSGIHFPAFTFENHAETEAFGKMAKKMGFRVGGLPHYTLWHIYEPSDDDLLEIASKERENNRS